MVQKIQAFASFNDKLFFSEKAALKDEMRSELNSLVIDWSSVPPQSTEEWLEFLFENPEAIVRVLSPLASYLAQEKAANYEMKLAEANALEEGKVK